MKEISESPFNFVGKNHEDLSSINKSSIIKYLRQNGVCSRAQISKAMGLTQASISKIIGQLIRENIVFETGFISGEKGRRSVGVALNTRCKKVLGVRLSRRSFAIGLFDLSGDIYENISGQFAEDATLHSVIERIKASLISFLERYSDIAAIGVAVPGPFNAKTAEIVLTTSMATSDWTNIRLREEFGDDFAVPIVFCHDAMAGALADWWFGSGAKEMHATLAHFLVGDGVGAGIITDGEIQGSRQGFSSEVGHISLDINGPHCRCGNRGCLELYCSTFAFLKDVKSRLPAFPDSALARLPDIKPQDVFNVAASGDPLAVQCVDRLGTYIGYGAVNLINAYVPDVIIISNEMAKGGQRILDRVREVVSERVSAVVAGGVSIMLEDDRLMTDPVLYGAGAVAISHCLESPLSLLGGGALSE